MALRGLCLSTLKPCIRTTLSGYSPFTPCYELQRFMVGIPQVFARNVSSHSSPKICESSDKSCIICYHPTNPFAYENTQPIPRPDPSSPKEAVEGVLKVKFQSERWKKEKEGPTPEELGKMFYTTKHRWYPIGIRRRMVKRPPPKRERPYL